MTQNISRQLYKEKSSIEENKNFYPNEKYNKLGHYKCCNKYSCIHAFTE